MLSANVVLLKDPEKSTIVKNNFLHSHENSERRAEAQQLRVWYHEQSDPVSLLPSKVERTELQSMDFLSNY